MRSCDSVFVFLCTDCFCLGGGDFGGQENGDNSFDCTPMWDFEMSISGSKFPVMLLLLLVFHTNDWHTHLDRIVITYMMIYM